MHTYNQHIMKERWLVDINDYEYDKIKAVTNKQCSAI